MEVLMKIGPYAGQLQDVKAIYARGLVARGEAIDPNMPLELGGEVTASPALIGERGGETILPTKVVEQLVRKAKGR